MEIDFNMLKELDAIVELFNEMKQLRNSETDQLDISRLKGET
jgi:hypothetical protein